MFETIWPCFRDASAKDTLAYRHERDRYLLFRHLLDEPLQLETIFTTQVGFHDTVLFQIDSAGQRIDFRSSSNFGLYDFGKNRSRMKEFTTCFEKTLAGMTGG